MKRSFFCMSKPKINYELIDGRLSEPKQIALPPTVTLMLDDPFTRNDIDIKIGDSVKKGQKLTLKEGRDAYVISSVSGKITGVSGFVGDYGKSYTAITIETAKTEEEEDSFTSLIEEPSLQTAADYLSFLPGEARFDVFQDPEKPIETIVVFGGNTDLLITTNQYVIKYRIDDVVRGIEILKKITGIEDIIIALPRDLVPGFGHTGAELRGVDLTYPSAHPKVIMDKVMGRPVPAGKTCEDMGVVFMSAEAVASIGKAFETGRIPADKIVTLVKKDGEKELVSARLGTPMGHIFKSCGVTVRERDRLIIGGPLTGSAIYAEDYPVGPDTDAVMVQDKADISLVSDYPCVNCGECVRICPANIPVNMLVRLLEAGLYEEAADDYDLYSCIGCGLCSYVCVAKVPVFQYIRLAKYELNRAETAEAAHE
ncbi:MAG: 4Fe-4S dicluster domain-containing protein [Desulfobacterales bacterium]